MPDSAKVPQFGDVIAVGPGKTNANGDRVTMQVKSGDKIVFSKYAGTEVRVDGQDYLVLKQDDVLAVVEHNCLIEEKKMSVKDICFTTD